MKTRMRVGFRTGWPFPNKAVFVIWVGAGMSRQLLDWSEQGRTLLRAAGYGEIADRLVCEVSD